MDREDKVAPPEAGSGPEPEKGRHSSASSITDNELNLSQGHQLQRGLKSRHIQFLALGGA